MNFWQALKGLKAVGVGNAVRAIPYARFKDRLEKRFWKSYQTHPVIQPGRFMRSVPEKDGASITFENCALRISFLTESIVRMSWTPGLLPVGYTVEGADPKPVNVTLKQSSKGWEVSAGSLTVRVRTDGSAEYVNAAGAVFRTESVPERPGSAWRHTSPLTASAAVFGLGERTSGLNLRPGSYRLYNREPRGTYKPGSDPLYLSVPFYQVICDEFSYGLFYENSFDSTVDIQDSIAASFTGGSLRYYVIEGSPKEILERYSWLTGRPSMPPRWALGYHQSRWSYKTTEEVLEIADGFRKNDIPLGAIHLDIHYMDGYRVFTVDKNRFKDLSKLSAELAGRGIHLVAILDPGVKFDAYYFLFIRGCEDKHFVQLPDGGLAKGPVWPGVCAFPDFTSARTRSWWAEQYKVFAQWGIDGVWHDMNEPAVFTPWGMASLPVSAVHDMEGRKGTHLEAHNLYGLLEAKAGFEGLKKARPDRRPWILSRSGWAGLQRYAWHWTGDCPASWWMVRQSIRMTLGLAMSGIPYSGHDTGGFSGDPDAELYTRWFQLSAMLPFFRTHSAAFVKKREPWSFGDPFTSICRKYVKLRYEMMPLWYTLAYEASISGAPLVRPMIYQFPDLLAFAKIDDQFMLGDSLIIAPVCEPGDGRRNVLLPPGVWVDYWSDRPVNGGRDIEVQASLDQIPVFVRSGAILPFETDKVRNLHVYVPKACDQALGSCYEDSGDGYGGARIDTWKCSIDGLQGVLHWERQSVGGGYPTGCNSVRIHFHGRQVLSATADGVACRVVDGVVETGPQFESVSFRLSR